ncbi:hypothetical protein PX52LOC_03188 [Limnoglobus roseus]|uniref:Uncharacterized protein n=1 Tax=Limnoglobus roseus TaxID=2598579 RepID=A0A5C1AH10_9BACT|nr:hypothetical protein PX52LOC_03188 [Limnoglobus roseus]
MPVGGVNCSLEVVGAEGQSHGFVLLNAMPTNWSDYYELAQGEFTLSATIAISFHNFRPSLAGWWTRPGQVMSRQPFRDELVREFS